MFSKNSISKALGKTRKFLPEIIKDKSTNEIRSVLEFPLNGEDHGAVYTCRSFAEATMSEPQESALKATFNVTCKLINVMFLFLF